MISDFHHKVAENCALLGYYAASSGNFWPTFQDKLLVPSSGLNSPYKHSVGIVFNFYLRGLTIYIIFTFANKASSFLI